MFVEKNSTKVIAIDEEIKIVGINLQKSGLPITFESLGKLWGIYGDNHRGKEKNALTPIVEYAVCLNKVPDYISGCAVTEIGELKEGWMSFVIPKGKYIKDTWNAETCQKLCEVVGDSFKNVKKWAKTNKIKINGEFSIEVYPNEALEGTNIEMYTLTPVKD